MRFVSFVYVVWGFVVKVGVGVVGVVHVLVVLIFVPPSILAGVSVFIEVVG